MIIKDNDEFIMELIVKIDDIVTEHSVSRGHNTAFDVLGAMAYFSGMLMATAPDAETRQEASAYFTQMLQEGLTQDQHVKH